MIDFQIEKAKHWQGEVKTDASGRTMVGLAIVALFDVLLWILAHLKQNGVE